MTTKQATRPAPLHTFAVGDGVHWGAGTDTQCGTVVHTKGASVYVVEDSAKLLTSSSA